jgi:protein SCO1/2
MKNHSKDCSTRRLLLGRMMALCALGAVRLAHTAQRDSHQEHDDHRAHRAEAAKTQVKRSLQKYLVPQVSLLDQHGNKAPFGQQLDDGRVVILNFIFTSCAAICPVMTQIFAQVQGQLGSARDKVHMVSVSIDPEHDTPARLLAYAKEYRAGPQWDFYTGPSEASVAVQKAFDAYRGDKMNHTPLTLMRATAAREWVRLDGFASPDRIVQEYRALAK